MNEPFSIERVDHGRDYELVYREGDHELRLWMDLTGFFQSYARVAGLEDLNSWAIPVGEPISTEAAAIIRARIEDWGTAHATRIGFVSTISLEEHWKWLEQQGYRKEVRADGVAVFHPPPLSARMARLWRRLIRPLARFALVLGVFALSPHWAFGQGADTDSVVEAAVFRRLKQAIADNDRDAVAASFVYPFRVNRSRTSHLWVRTRAELLRRYDAILTPKVREAILAQNPDSLFHSWRGSMAGNGVVWIDGVCEDRRAQKCRFGVTAINLR